MENKEKTICLCAIMKDEGQILPRFIESFAPIIDYWVVIDTGSTDLSMDILTKTMAEKEIPGELYQEPWVNFEINRNQLLEKAFAKADFLLLMDIDMTVDTTKEFDKKKLVAGAYQIHYTGKLDFAQQLLVSGYIRWKYVGVTHEYIHSDQQYAVGDLRSFPVTHHSDGGCRGEKYERDRLLLEKDIIDNPENTRSYFYLAQTYNNMQLHDKAIKYYRQRIKRGSWLEEVYYSKYQIGIMYMKLNKRDEAKIAFMEAWEFRPSRFEAIYMLGMMAREDKLWNQGCMYLEKAKSLPYPSTDLLFIHREIFEYLIDFDFAIALFYTGRFEEADKANQRVLANESTPDEIKKQAVVNQKHVHQKLGIVTEGEPIKKNFFVVSFFTEGTNYKDDVDMLAASCLKYKISHEFYQVASLGSWEKNTQHKAVIIRDALMKYQRPIVWVDADARFKKYPELFHIAPFDVMYHYIEPWDEILVGTIYFEFNQKTVDFINKWIELNSTNDNPDGVNFQKLIAEDRTLRKGIMPKEYCSIFDNEHTICDDPVIVHTQASRRNRGAKPKEETQGYESGIYDYMDSHRPLNGDYAIIGNGPFISDLSEEIDQAFVMRCNNFKSGDEYRGIGTSTDLNISSLYIEIIPQTKVPYPILGILPITDTGYQKFTDAKQMHSYWKENAKNLMDMGNTVLTYSEMDRFFHEVFLPIAEGIKAFPTVGILAIGLARWMGAKRIILSGFTFFETDKSHYFTDNKIQPSTHHRPSAEKLLLRSWIETDKIYYIMDGLTRTALYGYKKKKWMEVSQPFEINWHKTHDDWRPKQEEWDKCKKNILDANPDLAPLKYSTIKSLDVGCGPRSMLEFFPGLVKTMIEPLGEQYKEMYGYLNGDPLYCKPAEEFIPALENEFEFVWCHNVLDHCYDWKLVLENIFRYMKDDGIFYIATDAGFPPNDGHPGIESTAAFMKELERYKIEYLQKDIREPEAEMKRRAKEGANHQIRSINLIGNYHAADTDKAE